MNGAADPAAASHAPARSLSFPVSARLQQSRPAPLQQKISSPPSSDPPSSGHGSRSGSDNSIETATSSIARSGASSTRDPSTSSTQRTSPSPGCESPTQMSRSDDYLGAGVRQRRDLGAGRIPRMPTPGCESPTQMSKSDDHLGAGLRQRRDPSAGRIPRMPSDHPLVPPEQLDKYSHLSPDHLWVDKGPRFKGCPCPAMNTLSNHSYITPKDAYDRLPWYKWVKGIMACYNVGLINALFLTFSATILCGNVWSVSLHDLGKHGHVEHDASITRWDYETGKDYVDVNPERLLKFLEDAADHNKDPGLITLQNYAWRRCHEESRMLQPETTFLKALWTKLWVSFVGRGEVALTMRIFGGDEHRTSDGGMAVNREWLRTWFLYEKMPDDWRRPSKPFGIIDTLKVGLDLNQRMRKLRTEHPQLMMCARPWNEIRNKMEGVKIAMREHWRRRTMS